MNDKPNSNSNSSYEIYFKKKELYSPFTQMIYNLIHKYSIRVNLGIKTILTRASPFNGMLLSTCNLLNKTIRQILTSFLLISISKVFVLPFKYSSRIFINSYMYIYVTAFNNGSFVISYINILNETIPGSIL